MGPPRGDVRDGHVTLARTKLASWYRMIRGPGFGRLNRVRTDAFNR
jgi:hypothetical protein